MGAESPDHAGLRADAALGFAKQARLSMSYQAPFNQDEHLAQWFIKVYAKGNADGRDSQSAELANLKSEFGSANAFGDKCTESIEEMGIEVNRLRKDNAELQREVNALAGQVQEMRETIAGLRDENFRLAEARVGR